VGVTVHGLAVNSLQASNLSRNIKLSKYNDQYYYITSFKSKKYHLYFCVFKTLPILEVFLSDWGRKRPASWFYVEILVIKY